MSNNVSLVMFCGTRGWVAVEGRNIDSFVPLSQFHGACPPDEIPLFFSSMRMGNENFDEKDFLCNYVMKLVEPLTDGGDLFLTPKPGELLEYAVEDLFAVPALVSAVGGPIGLAGYCTYKSSIAPVIEIVSLKA